MKILRMACLLLFTGTANAVFFSSADLYHWLENDLNGVETYEGGMGKGYLMGILDMLSGTAPKTVCYPSGISALKLKMVVFNYMQNHQDQIHQSPDKLVYQALTKEWPCNQGIAH
jgi:hypothetical protein